MQIRNLNFKQRAKSVHQGELNSELPQIRIRKLKIFLSKDVLLFAKHQCICVSKLCIKPKFPNSP